MIKNGQLVENIVDIYIYEFTLEFFKEIEPDTEIEVRVRNDSANGRVIATYDKNIYLFIKKPPIDKIILRLTSFPFLFILI